MNVRMSFNEEALWENIKERSATKSLSDSQPVECDVDFFGPALPPHLSKTNLSKNSEKETIYGPLLPDHFKEEEKDKLNEVSFPILEEKKRLIGPEIPEHLKFSCIPSEVSETVPAAACRNDDNFGPSPALMTVGDTTDYYKFLIAKNLNKNTNITSESNIKREIWMTELPEKKRNSFGILPRHFKTRIQNDKEGDDSIWTDTPADKEKKEIHCKKKDYKEIARIKRLQERDQEMEKLAKKAAKKLRKKESLLEMHLKNMEKKKKIENKKRKKEGKPLPERRPFDRNVDLQIRKIDENQKRTILNKSQFLNDRFAPGQSKFL